MCGDCRSGVCLSAQAQKNQLTLWQDIAACFPTGTGRPDAEGIEKGHGRLEVRQVRVSSELVGYSDWPGLAQVAEVRTRRTSLTTGEIQDQVRYLVTSLPPERASPQRLLTLSRGHWGIENRLFHVKDDSFGEDRQVLQRHASGTNLSALRNAALGLLRGKSRLWHTRDPMTARAEYVGACPRAVLATQIPS